MKEKVMCFPDGTPIDPWFYDRTVPACVTGREYRVKEHGISDDGTIQTEKLQALIDQVSAEGGGTIVVSSGTFLTGALYFKQGTHLRIDQGAVLKGSDDIPDYPLC